MSEVDSKGMVKQNYTISETLVSLNESYNFLSNETRQKG